MCQNYVKHSNNISINLLSNLWGKHYDFQFTNEKRIKTHEKQFNLLKPCGWKIWLLTTTNCPFHQSLQFTWLVEKNEGIYLQCLNPQNSLFHNKYHWKIIVTEINIPFLVIDWKQSIKRCANINILFSGANPYLPSW